jgi:hypothetical protein
VKLAQMRLKGAGPLVYEMFCQDLGRSGSVDVGRLFEDEGGERRVRVGVFRRGGVGGGGGDGEVEAHFGISTATASSIPRGLQVL